jgi:hypothetical protein
VNDGMGWMLDDDFVFQLSTDYSNQSNCRIEENRSKTFPPWPF